jgi:hypothetical protein
MIRYTKLHVLKSKKWSLGLRIEINCGEGGATSYSAGKFWPRFIQPITHCGILDWIRKLYFFFPLSDSVSILEAKIDVLQLAKACSHFPRNNSYSHLIHNCTLKLGGSALKALRNLISQFYITSLNYQSIFQKLQNPWPESVSESYWLNDRRLSTKLVITFAYRGCHVVTVTDPYGCILGILEYFKEGLNVQN